MTPLKLSESVAFSEGSDLWVFCDPAHSAFARKIDFYLNFQMARTQKFQPKPFAAGLQSILKDNQLEELQLAPSASACCLISTRRALPCRYVVVVLWNQSEQGWIEETRKVWQKLGSPSLRLFLPKAMAAFDMNLGWSTDSAATISYVAGDLQLDA
jgi:hypothetical protein